jgi:hypothetical protein
MKNEWYGDKRDIVKWAVLLHLAQEHYVKIIVQIAYYRQSKWAKICINGKNVNIPAEVLGHFRDVNDITNLVSNPKIRIFNYELKNRRTYFQEVLKEVERHGDDKKIIFLDPDNGLAPTNATLKHVLPQELKSIWAKMQSGDLLVFYQHKPKYSKNTWVEEKRVQFVEALRIADGAVKIADGQEIASDVVFFYCRKNDASSNDGAA